MIKRLQPLTSLAFMFSISCQCVSPEQAVDISSFVRRHGSPFLFFCIVKGLK
ncbi:hypothetical protein K661_02141 [Piscirickettsia salmonis LF-89 = ATCC VR-1361]|nr:hypothetical protein K661_02141 [Piscirickettsia salmonis LF-89 = ATCC VR-1361]